MRNKSHPTFDIKRAGYNSTYKKLAVRWLIESLCFVSSSVLADSLMLRNRQLLVAANRYKPFYMLLTHYEKHRNNL
jgi:hypothetical protein